MGFCRKSIHMLPTANEYGIWVPFDDRNDANIIVEYSFMIWHINVMVPSVVVLDC